MAIVGISDKERIVTKPEGQHVGTLCIQITFFFFHSFFFFSTFFFHSFYSTYTTTGYYYDKTRLFGD